MRASYTLFPQSGYVLESFRGIVTYPDLAKFMRKQLLDPRVLPTFHTISDYTHATVRLFSDEVRLLTDAVCASPGSRSGKRALIIIGSRNFGFANLFQSYIAETQLVARCFRHRESALRWLLNPQDCAEIEPFLGHEILLHTQIDPEIQDQYLEPCLNNR